MLNTLTYRKRDKVLLLNVAIEKEIPESKMTDRDGIISIDLGIVNIVVTTGTDNKTAFHGVGDANTGIWFSFEYRVMLPSTGFKARAPGTGSDPFLFMKHFWVSTSQNTTEFFFIAFGGPAG